MSMNYGEVIRWSVEDRFDRGGLFPTKPEGLSRTRQEFSAECDINTIMAKYRTTGALTHVNRSQPSYYDFTDAPADLQSAMNMMIEAEDAFMRLPAEARKSLGNDAVEFVQFASDPKNIGQMREWGLAEPAPVEDAPMRVEVVNPPPAPAA